MGRPSKYPPEFRADAVELVRTSGRPIAEVARSLGLADSTLQNWLKAQRSAKARAEDPEALSESERGELARLRKENLELRTDKEILRKAAAYFAAGDDAVSCFRFVEDYRDTYEVKQLCAAVGVSRSGFYAWSRRVPCARAVADETLLGKIRVIHTDSRRTYGAPRVHGQLARAGTRVGCKRVARLMRLEGLQGAHSRRKWRRGRRDVAPAADRLNRDFTAPRPNSRWVADITEFPTGEGKLYLAGVRDLCHRGLVGWAMDGHQDAELVVDAMIMALSRGTPDPDGLVHHSDKGSQYTSLEFCSTATLAGLEVSFGSTGDCFDNAAMETFWSTLKREIAWIRGSIYFATKAQAKLYLFEFIEVFYNRQRHQAGLGHRTPVEYAATFIH